MNYWKQLPKPFTVLAPMEDVTDVVFRQIVSECGRPDVFFTEFTSVDGMASPGRKQVIKRLELNEDESIERPLVAQIWGKKPEHYEIAAKQIVEMGFDGIDINMGCPVRKIVKQGVCSALIDNFPLAEEIIAATKAGAAGKIPVSVKTRIGFKTKKTEEWATFLFEQGIDALTVHPRLAKDMSKKPADWDEITKTSKIRDEIAPGTVLIGNGDVLSLEQAHEYAEKYSVDGIMIGRGIFNDPFVFNPSKSMSDLSIDEKLALLHRHAKLFSEQWGDKKNFAILRRFFKIYAKDFDGASELRVELMKTEGLEDVENAIHSYNSPQGAQSTQRI